MRFEAEPFVENKRQHAGPIRIRIGPDKTAETLVTARLAFDERRICKKRRRDRLQSETDPHFLDHVRFGRIIEIYLHSAAAEHHIEAVVALLGHILAHNLITAFGHPPDIFAARLGIEAEAQYSGADLFADRLHFIEMGMHFAASLMDRLQHGSGKLELTARLQRDRRTIGLSQGNDVLTFINGLPTKTRQAYQQLSNTRRTFVFQAAEIRELVDEFFVLGADSPLLRRLTAALQIFDELGFAGDRFSTGLRGCGHGIAFPFSSGAAKSRVFPIRRTPSPITQCRLPTSHRRKGGGLRAQDAGPETHERYKREFSKAVKLRLREAAFGPAQDRPAAGTSIRSRQHVHKGQGLAFFGANQQAPVARKARQDIAERARIRYVRQTQTLALFRRFDHIGAMTVGVQPVDIRMLGQYRQQSRYAKLDRFLNQEIETRPFDRREQEPQVGLDGLRARSRIEREQTAVAAE